MLPKLNVTLVGAGHYARDLIYPKYKASDKWNVKATISPHSSIPGVPAFKTVQEWIAANGGPGPDDVFDLCVFADQINPLVDSLCSNGAVKIILPKPIAETMENLHALMMMREKYAGDFLVSSQWFYDDFYDYRGGPIEIRFGNKFDNEQYNAFNSYLPHALQILHKNGVILGKYYFHKDPRSAKILDIYGGSNQSFRIVINADSDFKYGLVTISTNNYDLSGRHKPFQEMVDSHGEFFSTAGIIRGLPVVELRGYYPIAKQYIDIKKSAGFYI